MSGPEDAVPELVREDDSQRALSAESLIHKSIHQMTQLWVDDLTDIKKKISSDSNYLCSQCETFPIEKCYQAASAEIIWTSPLKRILKHGERCLLCHILLLALFEPENDPMQHHQVSRYLPKHFPESERTMRAWVGGGASNWPFGSGQLPENEKKQIPQTEGGSHKLGKLGRHTENFGLSIGVNVVGSVIAK